jgi:hypothetical protein
MLSNGDNAELEHPIYLHSSPTGAPIRFSPEGGPQAALGAREERDGRPNELVPGWTDFLLHPDVDRFGYSIFNHQLFGSAEIPGEEEGTTRTAFWVIDTLERDDGYNLWSTSPARIEEQTIDFWSVIQAPYYQLLAQISRRDENLFTWTLNVRDIDCRAP